MGVPARARRPDRAGPAGPRRPRRQPCRGTGCARSAAGGRDRHRRCRDVRSVQLLPVPGVRRSATRSGSAATIRAGSRSPAGCRTSAAPATATRCTASPRPSAEMRDKPGQFGLVGANGGIMSKYSVGVYSTEPADWRDRPQRGAAGRDRRAAEGRRHHATPTGAATIETYSVRYDWPMRTGIIIGRLDADERRFMAITEDDDLVALMSDGDPLGRPHRGEVDGRRTTAPRWLSRLASTDAQHAALRLGTLAVSVAVTLDRDGCRCGSSKTWAMSGLMLGMTCPFSRIGRFVSCMELSLRSSAAVAMRLSSRASDVASRCAHVVIRSPSHHERISTCARPARRACPRAARRRPRPRPPICRAGRTAPR